VKAIKPKPVAHRVEPEWIRSIENAIEEIVRFCGPTALLARQATRDVQVNATDRVRR
jgi:hypothetical protein